MTAPGNKFGRWVREVAVSATANLFLGSPSIQFTPAGDLLAFWDEFGSAAHTDGTAADRSRYSRSTDGGITWGAVGTFDGLFWGRFLPNKGADMYRLGTSRIYGSLVISKSTDDGATWGTPVVLLAEVVDAQHYAAAPLPVVEHDGFLYIGAEVDDEKAYPIQRMFVGRVAMTADWLDSAEWEFTASFGTGAGTGLLSGNWGTSEGNIVPVGDTLEYWARVDANTGAEFNYVFKSVIDTGETLSLGTKSVQAVNGGYVKFEIRPDPQGDGWWIMHNVRPATQLSDTQDWRTTLVLSHVTDLAEWDTGLGMISLYLWEAPDAEVDDTGFQYPQFIFDGDDIIALVRVAWNGADSDHNSNRIQFVRIPNYRELI